MVCASTVVQYKIKNILPGWGAFLHPLVRPDPRAVSQGGARITVSRVLHHTTYPRLSSEDKMYYSTPID